MRKFGGGKFGLKKSMFIGMGILASVSVTGCKFVEEGGLGKVANVFLSQELNDDTIGLGLKDALRVGTKSAVDSLSKSGGYSNDPLLKIGFPKDVEKFTSTLKRFGLGSQVTAIENKMNEAAEQAAAEALPVFVDAVREMTFDDIRKIFDGNDSAATDYFRNKTRQKLVSRYAPIVRAHMAKLGVVRDYTKLVGQYNALPLVPKVKFSPESYVTEKALDGLFSTLAEQEKLIRTNPAARTTELLKRVFAIQK